MPLQLFSSTTRENDQRLLASERWKQTDFYFFDAQDELWQSASYVTMRKQAAHLPTEALVYLMQRLVIERENWGQEDQQNLQVEELLNFLAVVTRTGWDMPVDDFWEGYVEILTGVTHSSASTVTKSGRLLASCPLLTQATIQGVVCFANEWNIRVYFIETSTQWALLDWGTSA
jgi:hypothetical protein